MLLALEPCGLLAALCTAVVLLSFSCHHTPQIPLPLEEQREGQKLSSQSQVSGLGACFDKTHQGFLAIRATFTLPLPAYHHCLPFPLLTSPRGSCGGNGPQWDQLTLPETSAHYTAESALVPSFGPAVPSRLQGLYI